MSLLRSPLADPDFFFDVRKEERKMQEDGRDTVLLVRGFQGNTMVVRCGTGWTVGDLFDSLRGSTAVPLHLFYLVVEGRVIERTELFKDLGRDRVISMRGRLIGGSRNVTPIPGEWT